MRIESSKKKKLLSLALFFVILSATLAIFHCRIALAVETIKPAQEINEQLIAGRWVRTDGGYILEISEVKKDGSLNAVYLNPRPINVAQANWKRDGEEINIFVELRDVNYPGSKYTLKYDPVSDSLKGFYFQAVEKETYDIEFMRVNGLTK